MSVAQQTVETLLENVVAVCATCQQETGAPRQSNDSHGYCKRHTIEMHRHNLMNAIQRKDQAAMQRGQQTIAAIRARPDSDFPPDLSQQRQAAAA
jgi:hypothetical protein